MKKSIAYIVITITIILSIPVAIITGIILTGITVAHEVLDTLNDWI